MRLKNRQENVCVKIIILILVFCTICTANSNESCAEYNPYECEHFKVGYKATYSFYWVGFEDTDFVGIVTKIEPKPTTEYMHWITIKKISGVGTSGVYSELFLEKLD